MSSDDKSTGERVGWELLERHVRFENEMCELVEDRVELGGGEKTDYAYLRRAEAVIVVPVTSDGEIVLVKQYRYPVELRYRAESAAAGKDTFIVHTRMLSWRKSAPVLAPK